MTGIGVFSILFLFILIVFLNRAMKDGWYLLMHETGLQKKLITGAEPDK